MFEPENETNETGAKKPGSGGKPGQRAMDAANNVKPGQKRALDLFDELFRAHRGDGTPVGEIISEAHQAVQAGWSDELIQRAIAQGPMAIFVRLLQLYPADLIRRIDFELMALPSDPKSPTWQSATPGAPIAGVLGLPDALLPTLLAYYSWRRAALRNHWVCKCHSERN